MSVNSLQQIARQLNRGAVGLDVFGLQAILKARTDSPDLEIDGRFGDETFRALKKLQHDLGVEENGVFNMKTQGTLLGVSSFEDLLDDLVEQGFVELLELVEDGGDEEEDDIDDGEDVVEEDVEIKPDQSIPVQTVPGGDPREGYSGMDAPVSC